MTIMTWTRQARCKDCKFLYSFRKGKLKRHACGNLNSEFHEKERTLNDLVCKDWKL